LLPSKPRVPAAEASVVIVVVVEAVILLLEVVGIVVGEPAEAPVLLVIKRARPLLAVVVALAEAVVAKAGLHLGRPRCLHRAHHATHAAGSGRRSAGCVVIVLAVDVHIRPARSLRPERSRLRGGALSRGGGAAFGGWGRSGRFGPRCGFGQRGHGLRAGAVHRRYIFGTRRGGLSPHATRAAGLDDVHVGIPSIVLALSRGSVQWNRSQRRGRRSSAANRLSNTLVSSNNSQTRLATGGNWWWDGISWKDSELVTLQKGKLESVKYLLEP